MASDLRGELGDGVASDRRAARQKIALLPQRPPRRLGIDETTFRRYGSFMTGLVDLDTSRLWDLIEGRSTEGAGQPTSVARRERARH